jgi:hypothetical protein
MIWHMNSSDVLKALAPLIRRSRLRRATVMTLLGTIFGAQFAFSQDNAPVLRGSTTVIDAPPLKTGSLYSGLGKKKFGIGAGASGASFTAAAASTTTSPLTAGARKLLLKTFAKMTCVEYNELSANYYTAEHNYHPVSLGATVALPGFWGSNVQCFTDGKRLIAIDPKSYDTWVARAGADVTSRASWRKLTHIKN